MPRIIPVLPRALALAFAPKIIARMPVGRVRYQNKEKTTEIMPSTSDGMCSAGDFTAP